MEKASAVYFQVSDLRQEVVLLTFGFLGLKERILALIFDVLLSVLWLELLGLIELTQSEIYRSMPLALFKKSFLCIRLCILGDLNFFLAFPGLHTTKINQSLFDALFNLMRTYWKVFSCLRWSIKSRAADDTLCQDGPGLISKFFMIFQVIFLLLIKLMGNKPIFLRLFGVVDKQVHEIAPNYLMFAKIYA